MLGRMPGRCRTSPFRSAGRKVRNREGFRMPARRERSTRYRGRRRKASDERTRRKAVSAWRLWGFGAGAAVAVDGFAKITES